jgi:hypothetical protein
MATANVSTNLSHAFWFKCIPARLVIAFLLYVIPVRWLPLVGGLSLLGVIGLTYRTLTFTKTQRGAFNQPVTWNAARPFHAVVWLLFAILAIQKNTSAKIIPFLDVAFGIFAHSVMS